MLKENNPDRFKLKYGENYNENDLVKQTKKFNKNNKHYLSLTT